MSPYYPPGGLLDEPGQQDLRLLEVQVDVFNPVPEQQVRSVFPEGLGFPDGDPGDPELGVGWGPWCGPPLPSQVGFAVLTHANAAKSTFWAGWGIQFRWWGRHSRFP